MGDVVIRVPTGRVEMTPYYMARFSCDIFSAASAADTNAKLPWPKYFLLCVAIELGLKAVLLCHNNTPTQSKRNKQIGHNLTNLRKAAVARLSEAFLSEADIEAIDKISGFFQKKSLEYLSPELLYEMLTGGRALPEIAALEAVASRIVEHLQREEYLRHSETPA